jgi:hypothetical protein
LKDSFYTTRLNSRSMPRVQSRRLTIDCCDSSSSGLISRVQGSPFHKKCRGIIPSQIPQERDTVLSKCFHRSSLQVVKTVK